MEDVFERFAWPVHISYEWHDWLDEQGRPVTVPTEGLRSARSPRGVERLWQQSKKEGRTVGPILCPSTDAVERRYSPMSREHAALFRSFAGLDYKDPAAIRDFALTYGLLGLRRKDRAVYVSTPPGRMVCGESYLEWALEICRMKMALELSVQAAQKADHVIASIRTRLPVPQADPRRTLAEVLRAQLEDVHPWLDFERAGPPRLSFAPVTLLAAMWLQFALSLANNSRFLPCKMCNTVFEISTTGFRSHREFCSESCKTNDYRKRHRLSLRLAESGSSVEAIATELKTNPKTVRSWLAAAKRAVRPSGKPKGKQ